MPWKESEQHSQVGKVVLGKCQSKFLKRNKERCEKW